MRTSRAVPRGDVSGLRLHKLLSDAGEIGEMCAVCAPLGLLAGVVDIVLFPLLMSPRPWRRHGTEDLVVEVRGEK
jgi:hypothetical protein